jgi:hypothetical protein
MGEKVWGSRCICDKLEPRSLLPPRRGGRGVDGSDIDHGLVGNLMIWILVQLESSSMGAADGLVIGGLLW